MYLPNVRVFIDLHKHELSSFVDVTKAINECNFIGLDSVVEVQCWGVGLGVLGFAIATVQKAGNGTGGSAYIVQLQVYQIFRDPASVN